MGHKTSFPSCPANRTHASEKKTSQLIERPMPVPTSLQPFRNRGRDIATVPNQILTNHSILGVAPDGANVVRIPKILRTRKVAGIVNLNPAFTMPIHPERKPLSIAAIVANRPAFRSALAAAGLFSSTVVEAQDLDFSLAPGSPSVPTTFQAADDIEAGGTTVRIPTADLGLQTTANVTGLSYGQAEAADVNAPYFIKRIAYSVDTGSGGNGAPIATEVTLDGAAGDTFALDFVGYGIQRFVIRRPFNVLKAQTRNLTVKTDPADPEDDIDALALFRGAKYPVYLTFPAGSGYDPASIYIVTTQGGTPQLFATATDLGLVTGDVIDAFALGTIPFGGAPPTSLNLNVVIWISLDRGSPSRGAAGDSILQAWPTPRGTVLGWPQMGLTINDEINALAVLDPAPAIGMAIFDNTTNVVWSGTGLQSATSPEGPYTEISGATKPYETATNGDQLFFRSFAIAEPEPLIPVESPTQETLYAVWGSATNDIYAVGDNGVVIHYDGASWSVETDTPPTSARLSSIYSAGADELYFGGTDGLFRKDTQGWSANIAPEGTTTVTGITKTPDGQLHIVAGRQWLTFDGSAWRTNGLRYTAFSDPQLLADHQLTQISHVVDAAGTTGILIVSQDGIFANGRVLSLSGGGAGPHFQSIWAVSPDTVFLGSLDGGAYQSKPGSTANGLRNSTSWTKMFGPGGAVEGLDGQSRNNVYAVGHAFTTTPGRIFHYNGNDANEWTTLQMVPEELYAVWVSDQTVVAVGQGIYMR